MNKKIRIGSIIAVVLLTLVSFSSVVGYSIVKNTQDEIITDEYDSYTPIQLVFQLISKLRNHKEIQELVVDDEVDIQDEIASIIENDEELNTIVERLKSFDCGCEDESTTELEFPIICELLLLMYYVTAMLYFLFGFSYFDLVEGIADLLGCWWVYN